MIDLLLSFASPPKLTDSRNVPVENFCHVTAFTLQTYHEGRYIRQK